jgi:hypothetical protein
MCDKTALIEKTHEAAELVRSYDIKIKFFRPRNAKPRDGRYNLISAPKYLGTA